MKSDIINRLTDQADEHASDYVGSLRQRGLQVLPEYYEQAFRNKFAELIVRECADIVDRMDEGRNEYFQRLDGTKVVTGDVLKHYFGIRE
jgi:hypothetical protein